MQKGQHPQDAYQLVEFEISHRGMYCVWGWRRSGMSATPGCVFFHRRGMWRPNKCILQTSSRS
jgi:hypothetical protein